MPAPMTAALDTLWLDIDPSGEGLGFGECPTCERPTVRTWGAYRWMVDNGWTVPKGVRAVQASHLLPKGEAEVVALECERCNRKRGRAVWTPSREVRTVTVGDRANLAALKVGRAARDRREE